MAWQIISLLHQLLNRTHLYLSSFASSWSEHHLHQLLFVSPFFGGEDLVSKAARQAASGICTLFYHFCWEFLPFFLGNKYKVNKVEIITNNQWWSSVGRVFNKRLESSYNFADSASLFGIFWTIFWAMDFKEYCLPVDVARRQAKMNPNGDFSIFLISRMKLVLSWLDYS